MDIERQQYPSPADVIIARIRELIVSGALPPGHRLPPERELALKMGVQRRVVRKALSALAEEGIVSRQVGRGTFVGRAAFGPKDTILPDLVAPMELMEARLAIEPVIAAEAALRAKQPDLKRMRLCLRHGESASKFESFEEWDTALHRTIAEATHNVVFVMVIDLFTKVRANNEWDRLKRRTLTPEHRNLYRQHHRAIVNAIEQRDAKQATLSMRAHLKAVRDAMSEAVA